MPSTNGEVGSTRRSDPLDGLVAGLVIGGDQLEQIGEGTQQRMPSVSAPLVLVDDRREAAWEVEVEHAGSLPEPGATSSVPVTVFNASHSALDAVAPEEALRENVRWTPA